MSGCRSNERLKTKTDGSKRLTYTGLCGDLEHLTIETRLINVSFECVMGECDLLEVIGDPSTFNIIRSAALVRMWPTVDKRVGVNLEENKKNRTLPTIAGCLMSRKEKATKKKKLWLFLF